MSGINSIWNRNLQMTPRSGWRGQQKGNRLSFLTGTALCSATLPTASPQDGCKVQIMDRLFPEREDMGWESGWAFYSGDEGDVYGEGDEYYESHCGFYDIRDICRIDPDIVRFLNLPYGTMQMRSEDGAWYEVIRDDEGEEET